MPAFCIYVSIELSTEYPDIRFASTAMNIFHSTFSKDIFLNWFIVLEFFSFGTKHPFASFQHFRSSKSLGEFATIS